MHLTLTGFFHTPTTQHTGTSKQHMSNINPYSSSFTISGNHLFIIRSNMQSFGAPRRRDSAQKVFAQTKDPAHVVFSREAPSVSSPDVVFSREPPILPPPRALSFQSHSLSSPQGSFQNPQALSFQSHSQSSSQGSFQNPQDGHAQRVFSSQQSPQDAGKCFSSPPDSKRDRSHSGSPVFSPLLVDSKRNQQPKEHSFFLGMAASLLVGIGCIFGFLFAIHRSDRNIILAVCVTGVFVLALVSIVASYRNSLSQTLPQKNGRSRSPVPV
jgi:hypothetical protein